MDNDVNLPINIAVVGHTNVGKTSLIRTLTPSVMSRQAQALLAMLNHKY